MSDLILSVLMLAGVALLGGAVVTWRRGDTARGDRRRAVLMVVAAIVMFANVAIWVIPTS